MQKWEYFTTFVQADSRPGAVLDELKRRFPSEKNFSIYTPRALIPQLDRLGEEGWELVTMHPVFVGDNGDIGIFHGVGAAGTAWTHTYLCSFKRAKQ